jgi:hypothetical protein
MERCQDYFLAGIVEFVNYFTRVVGPILPPHNGP